MQKSTTHVGSEIDGANVAIVSSGKTTIAGSNVNATGNLSVKAGELDILAVNDSDYSERTEKESGNFGSKVRQNKDMKVTNIGSSLTGNQVSLVTGAGGVDVVGSSVKAQDTLAIESAGDIRVGAGYDGAMHESKKQDSAWFSGGDLYSKSLDLDGKMSKTAALSELSGNKVELNAGNSLALVGVSVSAGEITGQAQEIAVQNVANQETTWSKHEKLSVSLGDVASTLANPGSAVKFENGVASLKLAEANYSNIENSRTTSTVVSSNLNADNIRLKAASDDETRGDVTVVGSNLTATDTIALAATGNVTVKEAKDTETTATKEQKGKAELSVTVKNEFAQIDGALKAAKEAEKNLERAKEAYDKYQKDVAAQEQKLAGLKQALRDGKTGIEQTDVDELAGYIDQLRGDESFYKGNIALAASDLATKTAAVVTQAATAVASSGTAGFNIGLQADLDLLEKQYKEYNERSVASNLSASNIKIDAGKVTTVQGSNLNAANDLTINTQSLNVLASEDLATTDSSSDHKHASMSMSVYGGPTNAGMPGGADVGSGLTGGLSADASRSSSRSLTHTNSQLTGANINLTATDSAAFVGANVAASDTLKLDTGHLTVASVQDAATSRSSGSGVNVSVASAGTDNANPATNTAASSTGGKPSSAGVNNSLNHSNSRETLLTSLTGNRVDINVGQETTLKGATIAALDEQGNDNGQLSLRTGSLTVSSLNNTRTGDSLSQGVSVGQTSSLDYANDTSHSKTKTLGTIGSGVLDIGNEDASDTRMLNRDVANSTVDIYAIDSHQGLKGSLDTRLVTEGGRTKIREEVMKALMIGNTVKLIATTEKVGVTDFFKATNKSNKTYEALNAVIAERPKLAADLQNPNLNAQEKERALSELTDAVMAKLGYATYDTKLVAVKDEYKGFYSWQTQDVYINDANNDSTKDLVTTAGHEAAHVMDFQVGDTAKFSWSDRETYAKNYGENFASYTDMALSINGYSGGMAASNARVGDDSLFVLNNTAIYSSLDKSQGDGSANSEYLGYRAKQTEVVRFGAMAREQEARGELKEAEATREEVARLKDEIEKFQRTYGRTDKEIRTNLSKTYEKVDHDTMIFTGALFALPEIGAAALSGGTRLISETVDFIANPAMYCRFNMALCSNLAEAAGTTAAGVPMATSVVPQLPVSRIGRAVGEAVETAEVIAVNAAKRGGNASSVTDVGEAVEDTAGSIRNVNPGYPTNGRTQNCVNCSVATDSTLGGQPASALPSTGPVPISALEQQYGAKFGKTTTSSNIAQLMADAGNGARGIVFGSRGPGEAGHVFNVVNQNGVIRYLDGQTGAPAILDGYNGFRLLRTN